MSEFRLCTICAVNFKVEQKKGPAFCSYKCQREAMTRSQRKCEPRCGDSTRYRRVVFSNGTDHVQQFCLDCLKTTFVPREIGINLGIIEPREKEYLDFVTDAIQADM